MFRDLLIVLKLISDHALEIEDCELRIKIQQPIRTK